MKSEQIGLLVVVISAVLLVMYAQDRNSYCRRIGQRNFNCIFQLN